MSRTINGDGSQRRRHWRWPLLVLLAVPAFTGYPLGRWSTPIVAGATWGWVAYWILASVALRLINGRRRYQIILGISVLITLPVVFLGAGVSFLLDLGSAPLGTLGFAYSAHYIELCLTMLTVVPLALTLVAAIPVQRLEQRLMQGPSISLWGKGLLMVLRVFNHIVFFVIPTILEVVREESVGGRWVAPQASGKGLRNRWQQGRRLVELMVVIATDGICSAVQFIPLWAVEIARLPSDAGDTPGPQTVNHTDRSE